MRFVVNYKQLSSAEGNAVAKTGHFQFLCRWLQSENCGHCIGLIFIRAIWPLVQLLDIRKEQSPFRVGPLRVIAHHAVEIVPKNTEFFGNDRVILEDSSSRKVSLEALQDDDVRSDDEKRFRIGLRNFLLLAHRVEKLPGNGQCHDFGLAASRSHLDAVASEVIEWR